MDQKGVTVNVLARHLHAAIERVREDMEKVEFWADAVSGFAEPVPDYDSGTVWLPSEQATTISSAEQRVSAGHASAKPDVSNRPNVSKPHVAKKTASRAKRR
jgi:hypothetical protein